MRMCSFSAAEANLLRRAGKPDGGAAAILKTARANAGSAAAARPRHGFGGVAASPAADALNALKARCDESGVPRRRSVSAEMHAVHSIGRGGLLGRNGLSRGGGSGGGSDVPGYKDVHDRRRDSGALNSELCRLRVEYEAACESRFEMVHPSTDPKLQKLYQLLSQAAQRAYAEESVANGAARIIPPILFGDCDGWSAMFKLARQGERIHKFRCSAPTRDELVRDEAARATIAAERRYRMAEAIVDP